MKKSFIVHNDSLDILDELTHEQIGMLFLAMRAYQRNEEIELDTLVKIAFSPFKNQFDRDNVKYEKLCEKNKLIAENRYKKKSTKSTTGNQPLPTVTKSTDNDSKSDSDNVSDSKSKKDNKRFIKPSLQDVINYCSERNNGVNAEQFINHYETNGWKRGKTPIKDWKACVRTWESNQKDSKHDLSNQNYQSGLI